MASARRERWIAFQYELDVYVAPYRPGASQEEITDGMRRVSLEGGAYPHWRDATTLEFAGPGRVFTYDAASGDIDTTTIDVRLPRDIGRGRIALTGGRVITVDEDGVRENATVVVSDGRINCVGACAMAPVVIIGDQYHGAVTTSRVGKLVTKARRKGET